MTNRTFQEIAVEIKREWINVDAAAKPYLDAMLNFVSDSAMYYADEPKTIVLYFLSNASKFRGETARRIKLELKQKV